MSDTKAEALEVPGDARPAPEGETVRVLRKVIEGAIEVLEEYLYGYTGISPHELALATVTDFRAAIAAAPACPVAERAREVLREAEAHSLLYHVSNMDGTPQDIETGIRMTTARRILEEEP